MSITIFIAIVLTQIFIQFHHSRIQAMRIQLYFSFRYSILYHTVLFFDTGKILRLHLDSYGGRARIQF